jgi:hypothetical protein
MLESLTVFAAFGQEASTTFASADWIDPARPPDYLLSRGTVAF